MKKICILGSTGSVGKQTIEVCRERGYKITALAANSNISLLEEQIREFSPSFCAVKNEKAASELAIAVKDTNTKILSGESGILEMISAADCDIICNSILGSDGILPTMAAISSGKNIAMSNKEPIVAAGEIILSEAKKNSVKIIPVDSEHSAIFQCLNGNFNDRKYVSSLVLTASGGPFYGKKRNELENITPEIALNHPVWKMGKKISIDSATLMNKGLELIEAVRLFDVPADMVEITVHRQSIVHSMVSFVDGSTIAQMGYPDMRHCVQFALTYPERTKGLCHKLDFSKSYDLTFAPVDEETFSLIKAARFAASNGGTFTTVLNAANEAAVDLFLKEKIRFCKIFDIVEDNISRYREQNISKIEDIITLDKEIKNKVYEKFAN